MAKNIDKGIILAGGHGNRLYPATKALSKQLLTVYDKPMIYYSLSIMISMNVRDVLIIINAFDADKFEKLLGDGRQLGMNIQYACEEEPCGIANAFLIAENFIGGESVALVLGDNIFCNTDEISTAAGKYAEGALTFGVEVSNPSDYGVAVIDDSGNVLSIEEKPEEPKSNIAVTGVYVYDSRVVEITQNLEPSARGELEITDVNLAYLRGGSLDMKVLDSDVVWFDAGTADNMILAAKYIASLERISGQKVGCIEEIAFRNGFIGSSELRQLADEMPNCAYRDYLVNLK